MPVGDFIAQQVFQHYVGQKWEDKQRIKEANEKVLYEGVKGQVDKAMANNDTKTLQTLLNTPAVKKIYTDDDYNNYLIQNTEHNRQAASLASIMIQNYVNAGGPTNQKAKDDFEALITYGQKQGLFDQPTIDAARQLLTQTPQQQKAYLEVAEKAKKVAAMPSAEEAQNQRTANLARTKASTREQTALAEQHELTNKQLQSLTSDPNFQQWEAASGLPPGLDLKQSGALYAKEAYDFHKVQSNVKETLAQINTIEQYMNKNKMRGGDALAVAEGKVRGIRGSTHTLTNMKELKLYNLLSQLRSAAIPTYLTGGGPRSTIFINSVTSHLPPEDGSYDTIRQNLRDLRAFQVQIQTAKSLTDFDQAIGTTGTHDPLPTTPGSEAEPAPAENPADTDADTSAGEAYGK